jgi:hypothetical protein
MGLGIAYGDADAGAAVDHLDADRRVWARTLIRCRAPSPAYRTELVTSSLTSRPTTSCSSALSGRAHSSAHAVQGAVTSGAECVRPDANPDGSGPGSADESRAPLLERASELVLAKRVEAGDVIVDVVEVEGHQLLTEELDRRPFVCWRGGPPGKPGGH